MNSSGFAQASEDLRELAETNISARRLGRLVQRVGNERTSQMEQQSEAYEALPLPQRQICPTALAPKVVCIQCDGGRMQIRSTHWGEGKKATSDEDETGRDEAPEKSSPATFWRETKVATLLTLRSQVHEEDPCAEIPTIFVNAERMKRLTVEIKGYSGSKAEPDSSSAAKAKEAETTDQPLITPDELHALTRPQPLVRSVVATTEKIEKFGDRVVAAAHARGFHAAERKAFVCDGMACNWTLHQKHFSHYTPILDFVHALCYVYHAAMAGRTVLQGWSEYCQWAQWLWSGEIELLIAAIACRQQSLGLPQEDGGENSPPNLVAAALGYLRNQQSRMNYPEYRKQGLPITSAYIESTIKQINRRVKGTEKFWSTNAEAIVQLRADHISETQPLEKFWVQRARNIPVSTYYKMAV